MKLNDSSIAQIVKLIQMALLTGTDIVDHLRMLQLTLDDNNNSLLTIDQDYLNVFNESIEKMMQNSKDIQQEKV
tara:strand:- start:591 stop:812 length:222 start_codon:yes stop_codon:yes gene_type:complete